MLCAALSVTLVASVSLVGASMLLLGKRRLKQLLPYLVSFAIGVLLGTSFFHLLPESVERVEVKLAGSLVIAGMLSMLCLETYLRWRHIHLPSRIQPFAWINLVGDGVHNFLDGLLIGASYSINFPLGVATTLAVLAHELPQEIGDFGVLVYAGFSRLKALGLNFLSALPAFLGLAMATLLQPTALVALLLPVAAGSFIYLAASDLVPALRREKFSARQSLLEVFLMLLGLSLLWFLP